MIRIHKSLLLVWALVPAMLACPVEPPASARGPVLANVKSFSASPTQVHAGESTTLSWEVENATAVSIRTTGGEAVPLPESPLRQGTVQVSVEHDSVFVLNAAGEGGSDSAVTSVVVVAEENSSAPLFTAIPAYIRAGEKTTLVWNAPGAKEVEIHDSAGQAVPTSGKNQGSVDLTPGFTTQYVLRADGMERAVMVTVAPALVAFQSDVQEAAPGAMVRLSWQVGGADSVTLSAGGRVLTTTTDPALIADGSFTDTIPDSLPDNGQVEYTLEAKGGGTSILSELTVYAGANPRILEFASPSYVKPGREFPVSWKTALADRVEVLVGGEVFCQSLTRELAREGTVSVPGLLTGTTIELRTSNLRGGSDSRTVQVAPVGTPAFNAFAAGPVPVLQAGEKVTLSWDVSNARHVKISTDGGLVVAELTGQLDTGSVEAYPAGQTVYILDADNGVGDAIPSQYRTAQVTSPARLVFSPNNVPTGAPIQLTGSTVVGGGDLYSVDQMVKNVPGTQFIDISETGLPLPVAVNDDDVWYPLSLPEPFLTRWAGVPMGGKKLYVSIDGYLVFSDTPVFGTSASTQPGVVAVMAQDYGADSKTRIYWRMDGTGTQRRLIIQWTDLGILNATSYVRPKPIQDRATMQVQLQATGEVVMAFTTVSSFVSNPSIKINVPGRGDIQPVSGQLTSGKPASNDTFRFFGKFPLPFPVTASTAKMNVEVELADGRRLAFQDGPAVVPPGQFSISEINNNPIAGKAQWIELQNNTAQDVDLAGWYLDLGGGNRHVLTPSNGKTVLPANGQLLLGQTASAAEGAAVVDYVYGTGFVLPTSSGTLVLGLAEGNYDSLAWTSAGTAGTSLQKELKGSLLLAVGVNYLTCPGTGSYGTTGQRGTPGTKSRCFKWTVAPIAGAFQPIATTGTSVYVSTGDNSISTANTVALNLPRAVKVGDTVYGTSTNPLWVDSNGYVALSGSTSSKDSNPAQPAQSVPNGVLAIFWDDLAGNATTNGLGPSGVYWKQFDPDLIPASGDEYTLVSWENWKRWATDTATTSSLNFQIKIKEATGDVEFHYANMTSANAGNYSNGLDATVWMESLDGKAALPISVNQALIQANTGYRFTFTP